MLCGTGGAPGIVKRLSVEYEAGKVDEVVRNEDGRSDEKVGETKDERESFLDKEPREDEFGERERVIEGLEAEASPSMTDSVRKRGLMMFDE